MEVCASVYQYDFCFPRANKHGDSKVLSFLCRRRRHALTRRVSRLTVRLFPVVMEAFLCGMPRMAHNDEGSIIHTRGHAYRNKKIKIKTRKLL